MKNNYDELFSELDRVLQAFLEEVDKKKLDDLATDEWTVKDVLGHITFWHQYYAQQYNASAKGAEPYVHRSLAGKNAEGQKEMKGKSKKTLVAMLNEANDSLRKSILLEKVPTMQYMKSRSYSTGEFLDVVIGHIKRHTMQVRRTKSPGGN